MRHIEPYRTVQGALRALDNGGRFYNIFTTAGDEVVTKAELTKAAGVFSAQHDAWLFFEMALLGLDAEERDEVESRLDGDMRKSLRRHRPLQLRPSGFATAPTGTTCIVTGVARHVEEHHRETFIMVPIIVDKVTTFSMVPIDEVYDVYEVYDTAALRGGRCTLMLEGDWDLSAENGLLRWGGVVRESCDCDGAAQGRYLEPRFYTHVG